jgi:alkylation response protein AidB-like acyl-CoA dehydrogenase
MSSTQRERYRPLGKEIAELLQEEGQHGSPFRRAFRRLGEAGIFGLPLPEEQGGGGFGAVATVDAMEGLALGCSDLGFLFAASAHLWGSVMPLASHAAPNVVERFLPGLIDGSLISSHGVTEPEAGSDVAALTTRIEEHGDELRVRGTKTYITAAPIADLFIVYGRDSAGLRGVIIPGDTPGIEVRCQHKLGLDGAPMGEVRFDCRLPTDLALGPAGAGMAMFHTALEWERIGIVAPLLGAMDRQLERSIRRARRRRQFGQPIGRFQSVSNRIVDMKLRLDIGRMLVRRAAGLKEDGKRAPLEAAEAKLYVTEAFLASSMDAMRTHGAEAYLQDSEEARDLRDAAGGPFYSGTSDVQKNIIARFLGL